MNPVLLIEEALNKEKLWEPAFWIERNHYLTIPGSTDTRLYFVLNGSLRVFVTDQFEEHTIRFGYKNSFIAALDSFINHQPTDFFLQALKRTELKAIRKHDFMDFVYQNESNLKLWQKALEQLVYQQLERERDILTSSPQERYKRVLARSPRLFQEIPHKYIASYLRMTPETLSRIKKS
ncbi:MAG: Crp/Fnr family transcriptional regulator [Candidatus Cyclobacteriaceae bacterium M3_2C_046]